MDNDPSTGGWSRFLEWLRGVLASLGARLRALSGERRDAAVATVPAYDDGDEPGSGAELAQAYIAAMPYILLGAQMATDGTPLPGAVANQVDDLRPFAPPSRVSAYNLSESIEPFDVVAGLIEEELGQPPGVLFRSFDPDRFARSATGGVFRATLHDGRDVAVKVQRTDAERLVERDLVFIEEMFQAGGLHAGDIDGVMELFRELSERLHEGLDFRNEAEAMSLFRTYHADDDAIVVPEVIADRSSARVLTMTYEPSASLDDAVEDEWDEATRARISDVLVRMVFGQLFGLQVLHADPAPDNIGFRPDGTVVVRDFGCVRSVLPETVEALRDVVRGARQGDWVDVARALAALGVSGPGDAELEPQSAQELCERLLAPLLARQPFAFGDFEPLRIVMRMIDADPELACFLNRTPQTMFVYRVLSGYALTLADLGAVVDLEPLINQWILSDADGASALN